MILRPGVGERNREHQRHDRGRSVGTGLAGVDSELVGEGAERGEDAGAAHDDPLQLLSPTFLSATSPLMPS